jgi:WD40 repeat protein
MLRNQNPAYAFSFLLVLTGAIPLTWQTTPQSRTVQTLAGHQSAVWAVAVSPDGNLLASGGDDKMVKLWDLKTGMLSRTLTHTGKVHSLAFSPDARMLASGSGGHVEPNNDYGELRVWEISTGTLRGKLHMDHIKSLGGLVHSVAFSPDGKTLAFVVGDDTLRLWDVAQWRLRQTMRSPRKGLRAVAFSPDGAWLAAGGKWCTLQLWDIRKGRTAQPPLQVPREAHVFSLQFSPDGKTLAAALTEVRRGRGHHGVQLWDVTSGKVRHSLMGLPHEMSSVAFSPDGKLLAAAGGRADRSGQVRVWEAETGTIRDTIATERMEQALVFSPDGKTIFSGGGDQLIKLWEVRQQ